MFVCSPRAAAVILTAARAHARIHDVCAVPYGILCVMREKKREERLPPVCEMPQPDNKVLTMIDAKRESFAEGAGRLF